MIKTARVATIADVSRAVRDWLIANAVLLCLHGR